MKDVLFCEYKARKRAVARRKFNMQNVSNTVNRIVRLAVLVAIIFLLEVFNFGMIKIGVVEMTILHIPVIVGAIILGPVDGAILGAVFGLVSFLECLSGKSAFGATLLAINAFYTITMCFVPRILMGYLCGLIFKLCFRPHRKGNIIPFMAAGVSGALLNTIFFMAALILLFGSTDFVTGLRESMGNLPVIQFVIALVGINGLIEAAVAAVLGASVSRALFFTSDLAKKA